LFSNCFTFIRLGYIYADKNDSYTQANFVKNLCKQINIKINAKDVIQDLHFCSDKGFIFYFRKFQFFMKKNF
jgi:hypothetical protein